MAGRWRKWWPRRDCDWQSESWVSFICRCGAKVHVDTQDGPIMCLTCGRMYRLGIYLQMRQGTEAELQKVKDEVEEAKAGEFGGFWRGFPPVTWTVDDA